MKVLSDKAVAGQSVSSLADRPVTAGLKRRQRSCTENGIEPRKVETHRGRVRVMRRRQHVHDRYARSWRSVVVEGHFTQEKLLSEPGRSHVSAIFGIGSHRKGDKP